MVGISRKPRHEYHYKGIYFHTWFESLDGFKQVVIGSASIVLDTAGVCLTTGATINSIAELTKAPDFPLKAPTWDKKRRFKTKFWVDYVTNQEVYMGIGYIVAGNIPGIYFKILNGALYGLVNDATGTSTVLLQTIVAATGYLIEAVHVPGSSVKFYVDGVLKGELTTHIPSGTTYAEVIIGLRIDNTAAEDKLVEVSEWKFLQHP